MHALTHTLTQNSPISNVKLSPKNEKWQTNKIDKWIKTDENSIKYANKAKKWYQKAVAMFCARVLASHIHTPYLRKKRKKYNVRARAKRMIFLLRLFGESKHRIYIISIYNLWRVIYIWSRCYCYCYYCDYSLLIHLYWTFAHSMAAFLSWGGARLFRNWVWV